MVGLNIADGLKFGELNSLGPHPSRNLREGWGPFFPSGGDLPNQRLALDLLVAPNKTLCRYLERRHTSRSLTLPNPP
jgi:hypothetical protein